MEKAKQIQEDCRKQGIHIIKYEDSEFAENIRENPEFPILFYAKGTVKENWTHGAGIIGARRCSPEGKECAIKTAIQMVEHHYPVISGLATGVDS